MGVAPSGRTPCRRVRRVCFVPRVTRDSATFTTEETPSSRAIWTPQIREFGPPNTPWPETGSGFDSAGYSVSGALLSVWAMVDAALRGNRRALLLIAIIVVIWVL